MIKLFLTVLIFAIVLVFGDPIPKLFHYSSSPCDAHDVVSCAIYTPQPIYDSPVNIMSTVLDRATVFPVGGAFDFFPEWKGAVLPDKKLQWDDKCFKQFSSSLSLTTSDSILVEFEVEEPTSLLCSSWYLLADGERFYIKLFDTRGKHSLSITSLKIDELQDIQFNGLQIFNIDARILGTLADILDTVLLFEGPWTEKDALEFVRTHMNITYAERTSPDLNIDPSLIPSGTYIATQKFDGSEVMIQYGTGSYSGHSVMAVRMNETLYVCESNGKNAPDYWPPPYGVTCHLWDTWMGLARKSRYDLTLMPLRADLQAKYDDASAQKYIESVLGLPYGFHNFLFGFIDTLDQNFPPPLSGEFIAVLFSILDRTKPAIGQSMYIEALNKRLDTSCTNMTCVFETLMMRNMTFMDAMIMPEQDSWQYSDGYSMVCDVFVLEVYKASGIFGSPALNFQATEFTPKDLYTLNIFDPEYKQTLAKHGVLCPSEPAEVCQIMGPYVSQFPDWNTVDPYAGMCERCPGMPPLYERTPGC